MSAGSPSPRASGRTPVDTVASDAFRCGLSKYMYFQDRQISQHDGAGARHLEVLSRPSKTWADQVHELPYGALGLVMNGEPLRHVQIQ